MARGSDTSNQIVVPQAKNVMEQFKHEFASKLGIQPPNDGYWGAMTTRDTGANG